MEVEQKSPEYAFLYDLQSPEHTYYRCGAEGSIGGCIVGVLIQHCVRGDTCALP